MRQDAVRALARVGEQVRAAGVVEAAVAFVRVGERDPAGDGLVEPARASSGGPAGVRRWRWRGRRAIAAAHRADVEVEGVAEGACQHGP